MLCPRPSHRPATALNGSERTSRLVPHTRGVVRSWVMGRFRPRLPPHDFPAWPAVFHCFGLRREDGPAQETPGRKTGLAVDVRDLSGIALLDHRGPLRWGRVAADAVMRRGPGLPESDSSVMVRVAPGGIPRSMPGRHRAVARVHRVLRSLICDQHCTPCVI